MIITCPNCGARYRLADTAALENARMRCAACDHRWTPDLEAIAPATTRSPGPAEPAAADPPPQAETPPPQAQEQPPHAEETPPRSTLSRTIVAVIAGAALAIGAAAVWTTRLDPAGLPVIGAELAALAPAALPLKVVFTARTTPMPSGDRLLEINGSVRNTGAAAVTMPDLEARLSGPGGTVRRWRIAAPVATLAPGTTVGFVSTATGFPADATVVAIRPAG